MAGLVKTPDAPLGADAQWFDDKKLASDLSELALADSGQAEARTYFRQASIKRLKQALEEMRQSLASDLYDKQDGARYVGAHALCMDKFIQIIVEHVADIYLKNQLAINGPLWLLVAMAEAN